MRAIVRGGLGGRLKDWLASGGSEKLKLFCLDFIAAMEPRGGNGREFVSAAALWFGLREYCSCQDDALAIAVELAMLGNPEEVLASLKWLRVMGAGSCDGSVHLMIRFVSTQCPHFVASFFTSAVCLLLLLLPPPPPRSIIGTTLVVSRRARLLVLCRTSALMPESHH
jgi:hypothetical protein